MGTLLRPNTAQIERRPSGSLSLTGEPSQSAGPTQVYSGLSCLIDPIPVGSRQGGDLSIEVEGVIYTSTHVGFFDGLQPYRFPTGWTPGQSFTLNGQSYVIAPNGAGAFFDIEINDRLTDEQGRKFLVLAVAKYASIMPTVQVRLAFGRSW